MAGKTCLKCGSKLGDKGTESTLCLECYIKWSGEDHKSMEIGELTIIAK